MIRKSNDRRISPNLSIRLCGEDDFGAVREIINDAAMAYKGTIPEVIYREPWMSTDYFSDEIRDGVTFWGAEIDSSLVGVMGIQDVNDVTLVRHSYVRTRFRQRGIGSALLHFHISQTTKPILVGCLRIMTWAISFYEKHGFSLVSDKHRDELRERYWNLSPEHVQNSVVLVDNRWIERKQKIGE